MHHFIGRESELADLRTALGLALAGRAQAALVTGEAGIGKTRLALRLAEIAAEQSALVLWGVCVEDPGAPAYWPWVQALRQFAKPHDNAALRAALGEDASCITQIWPDLKDRFADLAPPEPISHPPQARFRLFEAVSQLFRRAAESQALVLVLEDLHWADIPSLQLLQFAVREADAARVLFLATFRDDPGAKAQDVMAAQAQLQRLPNVQRVSLTGFHADHTTRLIEAITGCRPTRSASALVQYKSAGNPLLVAEIARYLARRDQLVSEVVAEGAWSVPAEIRSLIAIRWKGVSSTTQRVLGCAAVIGACFDTVLLEQVLPELSPAAIFTALDEACAAGLIEHAPDSRDYAFAHVLTRDVLYEQLPTLERARTHERVGTALEALHRHHIEPHVSVLAHHFTAALPAGTSAKAITYAVDSAEQARARLAFEETVRWLRLALSAIDDTTPAATRCQLMIALGSAYTKAGQLPAALDVLTEGANEAAHLGAMNAFAQAAVDFEEATWRLASPSERAITLLERALAQMTDTGDPVRIRLRSALVRARAFAGLPESARMLCDETIAQARRTGEPQSLQAALRSRFWVPWEPDDMETALCAAHEALALAELSGNSEQRLDACAFRLHLLATVGDVEGFDVDLENFVRLAGELQQPFHRYHALSMQAARALARGNLPDATSLALAAFKWGSRLPGLDPAGAYGMQMFGIARERGELRALAPHVARFMDRTADGAAWQPALALVLAAVGETDRAALRLAQLAGRRFRDIARDSLWLISMIYLAESCVIVREQSAAADLYRLLAPWSGRNAVGGAMVVWPGPVDWFLGMLCACLGRWESAERHFEAALQSSGHPGTRPWLAHGQVEYARMLMARSQSDDRHRARELLESAACIAGQLAMTALQEAARELLDALERTSRPPLYPGGLSSREAQVLRLVAAGKSNQQIAEALFRSPNTIANHVRSILVKLGTANRAEAAAFAARHGIL